MSLTIDKGGCVADKEGKLAPMDKKNIQKPRHRVTYSNCSSYLATEYQILLR